MDLVAHAIQIVIDEEISGRKLHLRMKLHSAVGSARPITNKRTQLVKFSIYEREFGTIHGRWNMDNAIAEIYVREESVRILSTHAAVVHAKKEHDIVWPTTIWYNDPDSISIFRACVRSAVESVDKI